MPTPRTSVSRAARCGGADRTAAVAASHVAGGISRRVCRKAALLHFPSDARLFPRAGAGFGFLTGGIAGLRNAGSGAAAAAALGKCGVLACATEVGGQHRKTGHGHLAFDAGPLPGAASVFARFWGTFRGDVGLKNGTTPAIATGDAPAVTAVGMYLSLASGACGTTLGVQGAVETGVVPLAVARRLGLGRASLGGLPKKQADGSKDRRRQGLSSGGWANVRTPDKKVLNPSDRTVGGHWRRRGDRRRRGIALGAL